MVSLSLGQTRRLVCRRQWEVGMGAEWEEGRRLPFTCNYRASSSCPGTSVLTLTSCMLLCRPLRPRDLGLLCHAVSALQGCKQWMAGKSSD